MKDVQFISVFAQVRYWEDATLNGKDDVEGNMPSRVKDEWCPIINFHTGWVCDWPIGVEADIHYKVCDAGDYYLLDVNRERIAKYKDHYVPDDILAFGKGYGDYIIFKIDKEGYIEGWKRPYIDPEEWDKL
jgi:hypothetical protein